MEGVVNPKKKKRKIFQFLDEGGWVWEEYITDRRFLRVFTAPGKGKWKFEWFSTLEKGIYEPRKYSVLVIGSPKWDINITSFKRLELDEYYYATKAQRPNP